jgi:DNA-binding transcriptional regulator YbjK
MEGEVHKNPELGEIIEYPENWEDMKEKYLEREKEQLQKVMEKRKAESEQELIEIASKAIAKRALRGVPEEVVLKDRTVFTDPKGKEILELKKTLLAEISAIGQRILGRPTPPSPPPSQE